MSLLKSVKNLPTPLIFLVALLSLPPVSSLFLFNFETLISQSPYEFFLVAVAYWVFPLLLVVTALHRTFLLIPLFYLECVLLLSHLMVMRSLSHEEVQFARYGLLALITLFTAVFLNKDILYPLLAGSQRAWRTAPRVYLNVPMLLWYHNDHSKLPIILHNCSLAGLGISALKSQFRPILEGKHELASFVINIGYGGKNWMLTVKLVRIREEAATIYAGLRVLNSEVMHDLIQEIENVIPPQKTLKGVLTNYWVRRGFRHAVLVLWVSSLMSLIAIPGCAKKIGPSVSQGPILQMTRVQPFIR